MVRLCLLILNAGISNVGIMTFLNLDSKNFEKKLKYYVFTIFEHFKIFKKFVRWEERMRM